MAEKLTTEDIRAARKTPPARVQDRRDTKQRGLVLRLRPSGVHTYRVQLGRGHVETLGSIDDLTLEQARALALSRRGATAKAKALGEVDPVVARKRAAKAPTFGAFVDEKYEPWATANLRTGLEQAKRLRAIFGPVFGAKRLDEISAFDVERWRAGRLKAGGTAATTNRNLNILRAALRLAVKWNLLRVHPMADVKQSKLDASRRVRYLSDAEEQRLRAALTARDDTRRAERENANRWRAERGYEQWPALGTFSDHMTPIVLLAINTGMRRGELFNLRWSDVDFVGALITVDGAGAKSGQTRHIPMNSEALTVLKTWHGDKVQPPDAYVFPGADGARMDDIKKGWASIAAAAGLNEFRLHDLRHSFASKLVMKGIDLNTVRELLGHASLAMTCRYAHLAPEKKAAAVSALVSA